ncbi:aromatic prenyltransferase [Aspergillus heteromorphus CBS 117.55]|uniref:Aromatic prenyltransferase n=1 Tax=Aspergillus heteromorphus CBS 117.55 TaxID=1448321 RepID=A0A317VD40_9EURO|nr:aromatic prenyltransferase [Aspergillus heteromorphus CBS 117.55]PWY69800.1 aromatic prenyltransferase [Aspergillus heteromorphus CBS 117.55]
MNSLSSRCGSLSPQWNDAVRQLLVGHLYPLDPAISHFVPNHARSEILHSTSADHFPPSVWRQLTHKLRGSLDYHGQFWWLTAGYLLAALLHDAGYSKNAQQVILTFYGHNIAPFLGVANAYGAHRWKSFMTDDHNPIELSWDWHTGNKRPTIRFSIEPVGLQAGGKGDPDNSSADTHFRETLVRALPSMNLEWFDHFHHILAPNKSPGGCMEGHPSKIFYAFDLGERDIISKAYFFPGFKARAVNQSNLQVLAEAIRTAPHCTDDQQLLAFRVFEDFVVEEATPSVEMDMLAIDMICPAQSRLKVYFRNRQTSFDSVRQTVTMGGRLYTSSLEVGLQNLRRLWDGVLGQDGVSDDAPLPGLNHRTAGILYNMAFCLGSKLPTVKVYIPVRHYARSDWQVVTALREYMYGGNGQTKTSETAAYNNAMRSVFHENALETQRGLHTYIGCSIQPGGDLRVVSYINAQAEKFKTR